MAGQAGYRCSVFMGSYETGATTLVRAHRWSIGWKVDDLDSTSFINYGVGQYIGGLTDFDVSFDCLWFQADNPHADVGGPDIGPGEYVSIEVRFAPAVSLSAPNTLPPVVNPIPQYSWLRCLITHMSTEAAVRDLIRFNFAARVSVEDQGDLNALTVPLGTTNALGSTAISHSRTPS